MPTQSSLSLEVKTTNVGSDETERGQITFHSMTEKYGEPKVVPEPSFIIGTTPCPVISRHRHPAQIITGMKVEWKDIDANIICSEDVANFLSNDKYAHKISGAIYVPDFSTARYDPDAADKSIPHFFTRLVRWN